jgi:hypothetical protein
LAPNQAQSARRFQINPAPPGFLACREATPPWAALRESDMRLISLSQLRDDELRFWQSEFRLHVGERCQELLLDLQGMWLVGEADLRCVNFKLLVLGLPGESV